MAPGRTDCFLASIVAGTNRSKNQYEFIGIRGSRWAPAIVINKDIYIYIIYIYIYNIYIYNPYK